MNPETQSTKTRRNAVIAVVAAAVLLGAGAFWYLFGRAEPAAVSLDAAVAAATADTTTTTEGLAAETTTTGADTETATTSAAGIEGTWTVDTSIGEFDFESATGSFAGFRLDEVLGNGIGAVEAVGRTGEVSGSLTIDGDAVTDVAVSADLSVLTTDIDRRNNAARRALKTDTFPIATFQLTEPIALPAGAADGEAFAATAVGDLTIAGVTQSVTFDIESQLVDDTIVVVASTNVTFADYDVSVPSAGIVVSVEDNGIVEMQLLFTPSG